MASDGPPVEVPPQEGVIPHVSTLAESPAASVQQSPQQSAVKPVELPTVSTPVALLHGAPPQSVVAAMTTTASETSSTPISFIAAGSPSAALPGPTSPSTNKPTVYNQENAYIESVYESVLLASGMLGHIDRGSDELDLLRSAIQDMLHGAMYHTSRSLSLLRLMAYNALNLNRWEEAFLAIKAYLDKDAWSHKPRQHDGMIPDVPIEKRPEPYRELACMALAASQAAVQELEETVEGIRYAEKSLDFCMQDEQMASSQSHSQIMKSRSYHLIGQGYGQRALEVFDPETRRLYQRKSAIALAEAAHLDADNWEIRFDLALIFCDTRDIRTAIDFVKDSIHLNPSFIPAWHLMVLLLTAQKNYHQALKICEVALQKCAECDENVASEVLNLQLTYTLLIEKLHGPQKAVDTYPNLFRMFTKLYYPAHEKQSSSSRAATESQPDSGDLAKVMRREMPVRAAQNRHGFKLTAGRLPRYKDFFKNIQNKAIERSEADHWQVRLWLDSAAMFRRAGRYEQAVEAWIEAAKIDPEGVDVWCELGVLHLNRESATSLEESMHCFRTALSICRNHLPSSIHLGETYFHLGKYELAEHILEGATKHQGGVRPDAWYWYAMVLRATNRSDKALQCFAYAATLEAAQPVTGDFDVIDRFDRS